MRMEIEKKVGGPRIRQQTFGPFHVADTVFLLFPSSNYFSPVTSLTSLPFPLSFFSGQPFLKIIQSYIILTFSSLHIKFFQPVASLGRFNLLNHFDPFESQLLHL